MRKTALLLLTAIAVMGCDHTSNDNDKNFREIFRFPKPAGVTIYHSELWHGRHLFFLLGESSWRMEMDAPDAFVSTLTATGQGIFTRHADNSNFVLSSQRPSWFAPKASSAYERWDTEDGRGSLFIDKQTKRLYLSDAQL